MIPWPKDRQPAAEDVLDGVDGRYAKAIDHAALVDLLKHYRRYRKPTKTP